MGDKAARAAVAMIQDQVSRIRRTDSYNVSGDIQHLTLLARELAAQVRAATPKRNRLFGPGHKQRLSEMWGIDNTLSLPLDPTLALLGK